MNIGATKIHLNVFNVVKMRFASHFLQKKVPSENKSPWNVEYVNVSTPDRVSETKSLPVTRLDSIFKMPIVISDFDCDSKTFILSEWWSFSLFYPIRGHCFCWLYKQYYLCAVLQSIWGVACMACAVISCNFHQNIPCFIKQSTIITIIINTIK